MLKCTMLFDVITNDGEEGKPHRQGGWSESHYSSDPSSFSSRIAEFEDLCAKRAALLPIGAMIIGQRYQGVDPPSASQTNARQFPGAAGLAADYPTLSMYLRVPARDTRNISPLALRCMPDARIVKGEYNSSQQYQSALVRYLGGLSGNVWRFKGRDLAQTAYPLLRIQEDGTFATEANTTLVAGDMVRVLRANVEDDGQVGGRFKVVGLEGPVGIGLLDWPFGACTKGRVRLHSIVYPQIDSASASIGQVVVRKVGKASGQYRGKASRKRR